MIQDSFRPGLLLRNAHFQTIMASSKIRTLGKNPMIRCAQEIVFETPDGIRLLGYYSPQVRHTPKGLAILLHGWEGSSDSTYILCTGKHLYHKGFSIVRINFRDHGNSHHLNKGLFYAVLLDEVYHAVKTAAKLSKGKPVFLTGFSLGGNFALRIAKKCIENSIDELEHIVSISPVLDPDKATDKIDGDALVLGYFLKKWRRSLKKKEQLYPDTYDFSDVLKANSIRAMTDLLLARYSTYSSSESYFGEYSFLGSAPRDITIPMTIITSSDDPIIPVEDFFALELNNQTELAIQPFGGHNGFIQGVFLRSWYEEKMVRIFEQYQ
jgi:predicted alpha/beta-fold hydrolase